MIAPGALRTRRAAVVQGFVLLAFCAALGCGHSGPQVLAQPPLPQSEPARLGAEALARGDRDAARALFERAVEEDPADWVAHARLAKLTGRAPRERVEDLGRALDRANAHPYDPRALADAGRLLVEAGRTEEARPPLERAITLASRDPSAADDAISLLIDFDPAWRKRRVVRVHVYADEPLRRVEGWRFRQRALWEGVSESFAGVLGTRFVVVGLTAFETDDLGSDLGPTMAVLGRRSAARREGLAVGFTSQAPSGPGAQRGLAEFLGYHLVVRDVSNAQTARTLAHEIAHVFGGIHVVPEVDSLMNPSGDSLRLDRDNAHILSAIAPRGFVTGGLERNVLDRIDRVEAIDAYTAALAQNLAYRKMGLDAALEGRSAAARRAEHAAMDSHLGDVTVFVARLLWDEGRQVDGLRLLEAAERFYGEGTRRGLAARERAEEWRRLLGDRAPQ